MSNTHRRIGLVHVLTSGARRAIGIYLDIFRAHSDLDGILDIGHNLDLSERGVPAVSGIKGRQANQAVGAALRTQVAIGVASCDFSRRAFNARLITLGII